MDRKIEPLMHMLNDSLPEGHKFCGESKNCDECGVMLLASNNEFMCIWVECEIGNFCANCFFKDIENMQSMLD